MDARDLQNSLQNRWSQLRRTLQEKAQAFGAAGEDNLMSEIRTPTILGLCAIFIFFVGFGGWSILAPIASAAVAPGIVSPDGSRKQIQHLEGGIIARILVKENDKVTAGQPLIELKQTAARANVEVLRSQRRTLAATAARLSAELTGSDEIVFPDWLLAERDNAETARVLETQETLFQTRTAKNDGSEQILDQRVAQLNSEIEGLRQQVAAQDVQLGLIRKEIGNVSGLVAKGLAPQPRLLALQRTEADLKGRRSENLASIARAEQKIGETKLQILTMQLQTDDDVSETLTNVRTELANVEEKLFASGDVLDRTVIKAPVSGTVVNLRFHTPGGVIGQGQPILDIVPDNDELIIDARVSPTDIDVVYAGLTARVTLLAFTQRNMPTIYGRVRSVSPDTFVDEVTGQRYYRAQVAVDADQMARLGDTIQLTAGMPADVLIVTGERTAFQYLFGPLMRTINQSFRET